MQNGLTLAMSSVLTILNGGSVEAEAWELVASACLPQQTAAWWGDLAKRRLARTAHRLCVESADLIREARDAR
jgi:hypothetical protein